MKSKVQIDSVTQVLIDALARIVQNGIVNPSLVKVDISADDNTNVEVSLTTAAAAPLISAARSIAIFSILDSDTDLDRTTEVLIGPDTSTTTQVSTKVIDADGKIAIAAANSGQVANTVVSNSVGSVANLAEETTRAKVHGVKVDGLGLSISALSDTLYQASSLDAENEVTGETRAIVAASTLTAGTGGVVVSAIDRSEFEATALPFAPNLNPTSEGLGLVVARVSSINNVNKTTSASIELSSTVTSNGTVSVVARNETKLSAFGTATPVEEAVAAVNTNKVNAGILAANVVNGSTTATISDSSVTTTVAGDVVVTADDDSFLDALIYINIDGRGEFELHRFRRRQGDDGA